MNAEKRAPIDIAIWSLTRKSEVELYKPHINVLSVEVEMLTDKLRAGVHSRLGYRHWQAKKEGSTNLAVDPG